MLITKITEWLEHELHTDDAVPTPSPVTESEQPAELLTLKECTGLVKGLSEHTVRQLAVQGIIPSIRTGTGRSSKILINKTALKVRRVHNSHIVIALTINLRLT